MNLFDVLGEVPNMGRVKHVIRAENAKAARDKFKAAHPGSVYVQAKLVRKAADA